MQVTDWDLRKLRVLRALSELGTVRATAEALCMTPSAVSQQLSSLAQEVGTPLLESQGRGVRPTEAARVLLDAQPAQGFVGGAAVDGEGRLAGMIDITTAAVAGPATGAVQISFVPTATIRKFLDGAGVKPSEGRGDLAATKNAVVRVICVRK